MENTFTIPFHQYKTQIIVVVTDNFEESTKDRDLYQHSYDDCYQAFVYYDEDDKDVGIYIFMKPDTTLDEIVHECVHAANRIIHDHGVVYTPTEDEVLAYYVGYIYRMMVIELMKIDYDMHVSDLENTE